MLKNIGCFTQCTQYTGIIALHKQPSRVAYSLTNPFEGPNENANQSEILGKETTINFNFFVVLLSTDSTPKQSKRL